METERERERERERNGWIDREITEIEINKARERYIDRERDR